MIRKLTKELFETLSVNVLAESYTSIDRGANIGGLKEKFRLYCRKFCHR